MTRSRPIGRATRSWLAATRPATGDRQRAAPDRAQARCTTRDGGQPATRTSRRPGQERGRREQAVDERRPDPTESTMISPSRLNGACSQASRERPEQLDARAAGPRRPVIQSTQQVAADTRRRCERPPTTRRIASARRHRAIAHVEGVPRRRRAERVGHAAMERARRADHQAGQEVEVRRVGQDARTAGEERRPVRPRRPQRLVRQIPRRSRARGRAPSRSGRLRRPALLGRLPRSRRGNGVTLAPRAAAARASAAACASEEQVAEAVAPEVELGLADALAVVDRHLEAADARDA